jgi:cobalt-precorrin 5A hydrolase
MIVAGFGFRASTNVTVLRALLGDAQIDALAVVADKADHPALIALAQDIAKPLHIIPLDALSNEHAQTLAEHQPERYGRYSVAETAALAAAGPNATLKKPRATAPDGTATMAIAQGQDA